MSLEQIPEVASVDRFSKAPADSLRCTCTRTVKSSIRRRYTTILRSDVEDIDEVDVLQRLIHTTRGRLLIIIIIIIIIFFFFIFFVCT